MEQADKLREKWKNFMRELDKTFQERHTAMVLLVECVAGKCEYGKEHEISFIAHRDLEGRVTEYLRRAADTLDVQDDQS